MSHAILETPLGLLILLFPLSELVLAITRRARSGAASVHDRGSMQILWFVIAAAVVLAALVAGVPPTRLGVSDSVRNAVALAFMIAGLALRWWAILTLGRFFTTNVAIHDDHRLVQEGPYRFVRHPSYTGLLLVFLGVGIFFGNWLSLVVLMVPVTWALLHRIRIEEAALSRSLGPAYAAYAARTKRLVPGVL